MRDSAVTRTSGSVPLARIKTSRRRFRREPHRACRRRRIGRRRAAEGRPRRRLSLDRDGRSPDRIPIDFLDHRGKRSSLVGQFDESSGGERAIRTERFVRPDPGPAWLSRRRRPLRSHVRRRTRHRRAFALPTPRPRQRRRRPRDSCRRARRCGLPHPRRFARRSPAARPSERTARLVDGEHSVRVAVVCDTEISLRLPDQRGEVSRVSSVGSLGRPGKEPSRCPFSVRTRQPSSARTAGVIPPAPVPRSTITSGVPSRSTVPAMRSAWASLARSRRRQTPSSSQERVRNRRRGSVVRSPSDDRDRTLFPTVSRV